MLFRGSALASLLPAAVSAGIVQQRGVECSYSDVAGKGATCESISESWGNTVDQFKALNPGVQCPDLVVGHSYCVLGSVTSDPDPTTTTPSDPPVTTSSKTTSTSTETEPPTTTTSSDPHSPTQPGLASNCDKFHYVQSGDQCDKLEAQYHISASQFASWNPYINKDCTNLWADYYVCVHVPGAATSTPTPTKPANGIETPTPYQPKMIDYCNKFYFVKSGEFCDNIAYKNGISVSQLEKWNPSAGSDCSGIWANTYACVGAIPDIKLATRYHNDCTGDVHNTETFEHGDGHCVDTGCSVASLDILAEGSCPPDQVRISYWAEPGCSGKWFGYGYASRDQCRALWTDGWKFKSLFIRCASKESDCVSQNQCTFDPEPDHYLC